MLTGLCLEDLILEVICKPLFYRENRGLSRPNQCMIDRDTVTPSRSLLTSGSLCPTLTLKIGTRSPNSCPNNIMCIQAKVTICHLAVAMSHPATLTPTKYAPNSICPSPSTRDIVQHLISQCFTPSLLPNINHNDLKL